MHPPEDPRLVKGNTFGPPPVFRIYATAEQVPNPDIRVRLIHAKDEFGLPMARLEWRLTDQDVGVY